MMLASSGTIALHFHLRYQASGAGAAGGFRFIQLNKQCLLSYKCYICYRKQVVLVSLFYVLALGLLLCFSSKADGAVHW